MENLTRKKLALTSKKSSTKTSKHRLQRCLKTKTYNPNFPENPLFRYLLSADRGASTLMSRLTIAKF